MAGKKNIINSDSLELLKKTLEEHKGNEASEKDGSEVKIDPTDGSSIIAHLIDALNYLTKEVQRLKGNHNNPLVQQEVQTVAAATAPNLEERLRLAEDELDEGRQRQLKGNLILSSNQKGQRPLIKSSQELKGQPLLDHINELLEKKYGVVVPSEDVQACHHLPNGSVILRIWRRTEGSAWSNLVQAIRKKPLSSINFWANFHLTHRRSEILYQLRLLKKGNEGYDFKIFSDENGSISVKLKDNEVKHRLTFHMSRGRAMKTFTKQEIVNFFMSLQ